jgi:hypothetical protein
MSDTSDDPRTADKARRDAGRQRKDDRDVLRKLMRDPKGRDWLYRFLEVCHIYDNPAVFGDTNTTFFRLGEQNVGKRLLIEVEGASLDLYMTMKREHEEDVAEQTRQVREVAKQEEADQAEPEVGGEQFPPLTPPKGWPST